MNDLIDKIITYDKLKQVLLYAIEGFYYQNETGECNFLSKICKDKRYPKECDYVALLAHHQLNSEKNKIKPPIEDMNYSDIFEKIEDELEEIEKEISNFHQSELHYDHKYLRRACSTEKEKIDKRRALEEIGNLGGMLAGLLAKVLKEK